MKDKRTAAAVFCLLILWTAATAAVAAQKSAVAAAATPVKTAEKNQAAKDGNKSGFFDFFKKNPMEYISLFKREEPKDMDSIVDYMNSRGIKGTPTPSNIVERGLLEFCFGLRGVASSKYIFMSSEGSMLYFIFEFDTRVEAEAAVPVIVECLSAINDMKEADLYAINKYRFVIGTKAGSKKVVNAIKQY